MENYAIAIANELIDIHKKDKNPVDMLRLMKEAYIAHGYILAIMNKSTDGNKADKVQAWKYGPVFPAIYYCFRQSGSNTIVDKATVPIFQNCLFEKDETPTLSDDTEKYICERVYNMYKSFSTPQLIDFLHQQGTPWSMCYKPGMNVEIPDSLTKKYYQIFIRNTQEYVRTRKS